MFHLEKNPQKLLGSRRETYSCDKLDIARYT